MFKRKADLILDDYEEEEAELDDEYFYSVNNNYDSEDLEEENDNDYMNVFDATDYEDDDEEEEENDDDNSNNEYEYSSDGVAPSAINVLSLFSTWFIRIGVIIMVILLAYFITQGRVKTLFLYIAGLIISFIFGYIFMFLLNKFVDN